MMMGFTDGSKQEVDMLVDWLIIELIPAKTLKIVVMFR